MAKCLARRFSDVLKAGCVQINAAVMANQELSRNNKISPPPFLLTQKDGVQEAYIRGVAGEVNVFAVSGIQKDWKEFCLSFSVPNIKEYCRSYVNVEVSQQNAS